MVGPTVGRNDCFMIGFTVDCRVGRMDCQTVSHKAGRSNSLTVGGSIRRKVRQYDGTLADCTISTLLAFLNLVFREARLHMKTMSNLVTICRVPSDLFTNTTTRDLSSNNPFVRHIQK